MEIGKTEYIFDPRDIVERTLIRYAIRMFESDVLGALPGLYTMNGCFVGLVEDNDYKLYTFLSLGHHITGKFICDKAPTFRGMAAGFRMVKYRAELESCVGKQGGEVNVRL